MNHQNCRIGKKRLLVQGRRVETAAMQIDPCDGKCKMEAVIGHPSENCTHCGKQT